MIEPHRIAGQFYNRPLLLTPAAAQTISAFLLSRFDARGRGTSSNEQAITETQHFRADVAADGQSGISHSPRASRFYGEYRTGPDGRPTPYRVTPDGTAIISIIGELVNRGAWVGASSGLVSYEGIKYSVLKAAQDPQISAILLDIESPGGEAVGAFETAATIRRVRQEKPVLAAVNGMAASAGFAIASAASRIISLPTGLSGSIGVVMLHMDISQYLADAGVKPTFIFAGDHKVDGNPYEPLPDAVRASLQAEIDQFYGMFVASVADGRRGMTEQKIRETQARIFMGDDAVMLGLADEVGTFDEVMATLASPQSRGVLLGRAASTQRTITMDNNATEAAEATATAETMQPEARAPAALPAAAAPAVTVGDAAAGLAPSGGAVAASAAPAVSAAPVATPAAPVGPDAVAAERERAAAIMGLAAQAATMSVNIDAAKAIADGTSVDALRQTIIDAAAARDEANAVVSTTTAVPRTAGAPAPSNPGLAKAAEERAKQLTNGR